MSDDRLERLLELADGPRAFPDHEKRALRAAMIATAMHPSTGGPDTVVPLQVRRPAGSRRTRPWVFGVAAATIAVLVVAMTAIDRTDPVDRVDPAAPPAITPSPTPDELCAEISAIGAANGLIGPGSPVDAAALDTMAGAIDRIARTAGDTELASRVRLLADAVRAGRGGTVINTVRAIGDDVGRLFEGAGPCSGE